MFKPGFISILFFAILVFSIFRIWKSTNKFFIIRKLITGICIAFICGLLITYADKLFSLPALFFPLLIVPLIEESGKFGGSRIGHEISDRDFPAAAAAVSCGFALWEQLLYILTPDSEKLAIFRSLTAVPIHILLGLISIFIFLLLRKRGRIKTGVFFAIIPSFVLHSFFNLLSRQNSLLLQLLYILLPIVILTLLLHKIKKDFPDIS